MKIVVCKVCGEEKRHYAKGMCKKCYNREYYRNNREKGNEFSRKWRRNNPEKVKEHNRIHYNGGVDPLIYEKDLEEYKKFIKENPEW